VRPTKDRAQVVNTMGDVVNLNKFRKAKAKTERVKQADVNRRLHGRTKAERSRDEQHKQQFTRHLDGARLEPAPRGEDSTDDDPPPSSEL
jgi:hypothetical protein